MSAEHAPSGLHVRAILGTAGVLIAVILVALGVLYWIYPVNTPRFEPSPSSWVRSVPEAPRLQIEPKNDWQHVHRVQQMQLSSYGWIDRKQGIVHIPIERAMRALPAQRPEVVIGPPEEGGQ